MRQALEDLIEAVEAAINAGDWKVDGACDPTLALIRAKEALAQPEQEPVAWVDDYNACKCPDNEARCFSDKVFRMMQKHTTPPQPVVNQSLTTEQEPVAWKVSPRYEDSDGYFDFTDSKDTAETLQQRGWEIRPLYTTPPQRQRLTITEESAWDLALYVYLRSNPHKSPQIILSAKEIKQIIEAAHGIKETWGEA